MFSGAGIGAIAAHLRGVQSWIDAKPFVVPGVLVGYAIGALVLNYLERGK